MQKDYKPLELEPKWQKDWEASKIFNVSEDPSRPKYYVLEMLPYPSGRLHMGHVRNYTIGDLISRYKVMKGFNVLHPIGWDAFGMPAENAAIKNKLHPAKWTFDNIDYMRVQFKRLGISYDWTREVATCTPEYYRWEQLVFLRMFEKGIVTRKESPVNWCNTCQTVLANEQSEGGKCWRCDSPVELKPMTQWFVRLPLYAEELLKDIELLEGWPERVKVMQRAWIGKSVGASIKFAVCSDVIPAVVSGEPASFPLKAAGMTDSIEIFTTRPDTIFGATFMSLAAENPLVEKLSRGTKQESAVKAFVERTKKIGRLDRISGNFEKDGVFTGAYCTNPVTGWKMPIYAANFVLMDYGTGAVMAVPAHDQRDFDFAKKYDLPIKQVVIPACETSTSVCHPREGGDPVDDGGFPLKAAGMTDTSPRDDIKCAFEDAGMLVNSGEFSGMSSDEAKTAIVKHLKKQGVGDFTVNFKLKDWCVSRQRYWGTPIPVIYCDKCGIVPVPENELPVALPKEAALTGEGGSPLAKMQDFVNCKCPKCGGAGRRETDTMDTFVESSWYFLRYCSPKFEGGPVDPDAGKYWMPVDQYIGGIEHAVGHLLYCRFYMKILRDLGFIKYSDSNEPVKNLLTQGMVTLGGAAMSKSRGNIVDPDKIISQYGADTARVFILFAAPPEKDLEWSDKGIDGSWRFLNRVWRICHAALEADASGKAKPSPELEKWMNKTIKRVTDDIERYHYNTAISAIMELVNYLYSIDTSALTKSCAELLIKLMSPIAPHMCEELWRDAGHKDSISKVAWPTFDESKIADERITIPVQVNGKLRDKIDVDASASEDEVKAAAQASEKVASFIAGKPIKQVIYVKGRMVNIVCQN